MTLNTKLNSMGIIKEFFKYLLADDYCVRFDDEFEDEAKGRRKEIDRQLNYENENER